MATLLAAPVFSSAPYSPGAADEHIQYRPAKNLDAFNSLLPPPIEFVEGSSTGLLAIAEGKYEPINASPKAAASAAEVNGKLKPSPAKLRKLPTTPTSVTRPASSSSLYTRSIETTWPADATVAVGLYNTGNTCFLNSALQCLMHTPPLLQVLVKHSKLDPCRVRNNNFCMSCALRQVTTEAFRRSRAFSPSSITQHLQYIAKHMRKGRQEDSHEFLRYAVDALQKSCLAGNPPKIDPKLAETTWVHKIFGGRLRSRVTCNQCGYNSDTFDRMLDLSIDIHGAQSLRDALRRFTAVDHLKGADKYKCEKCKKAVNAEKRFTIHEAPVVLTVHLKRFTPMGRKVTNPIRYDEQLSLHSYMSEGQYGPTYSLYGVVSHAGGGPNSGHYYAHVKAANGHWHEMNDESVERLRGPPLNMKNAYILFYLREKGQQLEALVKSTGSMPSAQRAGPLTNGMSKKRKIIESDDDDSDREKKAMAKPVDKPFIGPLLPDSHRRPEVQGQSNAASLPLVTKRPDPQAEMLKAKIEAVQNHIDQIRTPPPKRALVEYGDDDDDVGEVVERRSAPPPPPSSQPSGISSPAPAAPTPPLHPTISSSPPRTTAIPSSSFYGTSSKHVSQTKPEYQNQNQDDSARPPNPTRRSSKGSESGLSIGNTFSAFGNPFNRMTGGNTFNRKSDDTAYQQPRKLQKQYGGRQRKRIMI